MLFPHWGYSIFGFSPNFTHFSHFSCICKGYLDHVFVRDTTHLFELCYACDSKPSRIRKEVPPAASPSTLEGVEGGNQYAVHGFFRCA